MPGHLLINGIDIGQYVSASGFRRAEEEIGERTRAFSGSARSAIRARKLVFDGRTIPLTQANAQILRALLLGEGDSWSFDADTYSAKGRPLASGSASIITSSPAPKYGAGCVQTEGAPRWDVGNPLTSGLRRSAYVAWCWRYLDGAWAWYALSATQADGTTGYASGVPGTVYHGGFDWIGLDSTGKLYLQSPASGALTWTATTGKVAGNRVKPTTYPTLSTCFRCTTPGTTGGSEPNWALAPNAGNTIVDGTVTWTNIGSGLLQVDSLVYYPVQLTAAQMLAAYTEHAARAWTAQPQLRVTGTLIENAPRTMRGRIGNGDLIRPAAGLRDAFEFSLEEE